MAKIVFSDGSRSSATSLAVVSFLLGAAAGGGLILLNVYAISIL